MSNRSYGNVYPISSAQTLRESDSGSVFLVRKGSAYTITLPTPSEDAAGCHYRFINADASNNIVTITGGASTAYGVIDLSGSVIPTGTASVKFAGTAARGDFIDCVCDGTVYYYSAGSSTAAGITTAS